MNNGNLEDKEGRQGESGGGQESSGAHKPGQIYFFTQPLER